MADVATTGTGRTTWRRLAPPAAVLAVATVLTWPGVVLGGRVFLCRDSGTLVLPVFTFMRHSLLHGRLPLWFPYDGLGVPLLETTVSGLFHPSALLLLLTSAATAMRLASLLGLALAFGATFALARHLGAPAWAAAAAALAYAFGGPFQSLATTNLIYLQGAAAFPLGVLGIFLAVRGDRWRLGIALGAGGLALACLTGDIETGYILGLLAGVVALARSGARLRGLGRAAALGALGLSTAAVQLLPTLLRFGASDRGGGLPWHEATTWSLSPFRLPAVFLGDLVHWVPGATARNAIRADLVHSAGLWSITVFLGATVLLGVVLAWVLPPRDGGRRLDATLGALALILLWLALGRHGGLYRLAYRALPLFHAFRFPEKLALHASLLLAVLAARGLARAARTDRRRRGVVATAVTAGVLGASALAAVVAGPHLAGAPGAWLGRLAVAAGRSALVVAGVGALLLARPDRDRTAGLLRWAVPAVLLAELMVVNARVPASCSFPEWIATAPSEPARTLEARAGVALGHYRVTPLFAEEQRLRPRRQSALELPPEAQVQLWERQALYPDQGAVAGVEGVGRLLPGLSSRFVALEKRGDLNRWLPLFDDRYVLTAPADLPRLAGLGGQVVDRLPTLGMVVVALPDARPRIYAAAATPVAGPEAALDRLGEPDVLAGRRALVEGPVAPGDGPPAGTVRLVRYAPRRVVARSDLDRPAVVVLDDAWAPGWRASVDGAPTPIRHANLLVRAVAVPAGRHLIVFHYPVPAVVPLGAALGLAAWLVYAGAAWRSRRSAA